MLPSNLQPLLRCVIKQKRDPGVGSTHRCREISKLAEPMTVLQAENLEGIRDHEALLLVIRGRDSLKALEALQGSISSLRLVRHHSVRVRERFHVSE